jgi:hypothetical protein
MESDQEEVAAQAPAQTQLTINRGKDIDLAN